MSDADRTHADNAHYAGVATGDTPESLQGKTGPDGNKFQVVICGGGIGGLMLGAILNKLKISFVILERMQNYVPGGAGISIAPNAQAILDQLGLMPEVRKHAQTLECNTIYRANGQGKPDTFWRKMTYEFVAESFKYPVCSIERHIFHQILLKAAGGTANVIFGAKVTDVRWHPFNETTYVDIDGGRTFEGKLIVGADGIRSRVRQVLTAKSGQAPDKTNFQYTGRVHTTGITRSMPEMKDEDDGHANFLFHDDIIITSWPIKDKRRWWIVVERVQYAPGEEPKRSVWDKATIDEAKEKWGDRKHPLAPQTGTMMDFFNATERMVKSTVFEEQDFSGTYLGNIVLIGDAAHSMSSFFGQGGCQAIEDSVELVNSLYAFPNNIQGALKLYEERRGRRAQNLVAFSRNYARVHMAEAPYYIGAILRMLIFRFAPNSVWQKGVAWLYGYQPTVQALPNATKFDILVGQENPEKKVQ